MGPAAGAEWRGNENHRHRERAASSRQLAREPGTPGTFGTFGTLGTPAKLYAIKLVVADPRALHTHAIDELRYIRDTMARAGQFSAIPGWGGVVMGVSALAAAALAGPPASSARWLWVWSAD